MIRLIRYAISLIYVPTKREMDVQRHRFQVPPLKELENDGWDESFRNYEVEIAGREKFVESVDKPEKKVQGLLKLNSSFRGLADLRLARTEKVIRAYELREQALHALLLEKQEQYARAFDRVDKLFMAIADRRAVRDSYREWAKWHHRVRRALDRLTFGRWSRSCGVLESEMPRPPRVCDVSIIIGSYNRRALLREAVNAIRHNGFNGTMEIIVVDGGSTDGTLAWLAEQKDIITIIQHNRGEVDGRPIERRCWGYFINLCFKLAQGKYVMMLSDDCIIHPGCIQNGFEHFEEALKAGRKLGALAFYFRNWPVDKSYYVQSTLGDMLMVNHGMFLSDALYHIGYADETSYQFYKADTDLSLRLWRAGYSIEACPKAFLEHFYDNEEENRQSNSPLLESDREVSNIRWHGIFTSLGANEMFKTGRRRELEYDDPHCTAEVLQRYLDAGA